MGGPGAPDDMDKAHRTQAWLAVSDDAAARASGDYFYHQRHRAANPEASNLALQDRFLRRCEELSGVGIPH
jgi:hypothetical protein